MDKGEFKNLEKISLSCDNVEILLDLPNIITLVIGQYSDSGLYQVKLKIPNTQEGSTPGEEYILDGSGSMHEAHALLMHYQCILLTGKCRLRIKGNGLAELKPYEKDFELKKGSKPNPQ